jgi:hypothetical protein
MKMDDVDLPRESSSQDQKRTRDNENSDVLESMDHAPYIKRFQNTDAKENVVRWSYRVCTDGTLNELNNKLKSENVSNGVLTPLTILASFTASEFGFIVCWTRSILRRARTSKILQRVV